MLWRMIKIGLRHMSLNDNPKYCSSITPTPAQLVQPGFKGRYGYHKSTLSAVYCWNSLVHSYKNREMSRQQSRTHCRLLTKFCFHRLVSSTYTLTSQTKLQKIIMIRSNPSHSEVTNMHGTFHDTTGVLCELFPREENSHQFVIPCETVSSPKNAMVTPYTVVIGRGKQCQEFVGNKRLEVLAKNVLPQYVEAKDKEEKSKIVSFLVRSIEEAGGSFVRLMDKQRLEIADERIAREKVGVVLRNLLHDKYRSSTKSKVVARRNRKERRRRNSAVSSSGSLSSSSSSSAASSSRGRIASRPRSSQPYEPSLNQLLLSCEQILDQHGDGGNKPDKYTSSEPLSSDRLLHDPSLDQALLFSCEKILDLPGDDGDNERDDDAVPCIVEQNMDPRSCWDDEYFTDAFPANSS
jgi:hypothetical protein